MSLSEKAKADLLYKRGYVLISKIEIKREIIAGRSGLFNVDITLATQSGKETTIRAYDCIDVSIGNINNLYAAFVEVFDIREHQIESGKFKILDSEHDLFSLICSSFQVDI